MISCVIITWCVVFLGLSKGGEIPNYNLTVSNFHNATGSWFVELRLEHDRAQIYDMYLSHSKDATVARISLPEGLVRGSHEEPLTTTCLEAKAPEVVQTHQVHKTCPVPKALGYELVPGMGYYKLFIEQLKPWHDAKAACKSEGTHLLIINSDLEALVIKGMVEKNPKSRAWAHWIGFQDANKTGDFRTIFNDDLRYIGYKTWLHGYPHPHPDNKCGAFQIISDTYGLIVNSCAHLNPFICEREIQC